MQLSICLAAFNGEEFIRQQIESIIAQLEVGDEFILADDGSTDSTLSIMQEYKKYTSKILLGRAGGVNKNFERLILASEKEAIVLVDQDDVWLPGRLNIIRSALQSYSLVVTNGEVVDEYLNPIGVSVFDYVERKKGFFRNFVKNTYVGCCLAFKKEIILSVMPFSETLHSHDWLIGLMGEIDGRLIDINTPTFFYRRHKKNLSRTGNKSDNSLYKKLSIRIDMGKILMRVYLANKKLDIIRAIKI